MSDTPRPNVMRQLGKLAAAPLSEDVEVAALTQIGKYRVIRELARGAMGVVYEAEDVELKRPSALKILKELAGTHEVGRHRFQREAVTAARLSHPNVVQVYDAGEEQGRLYLAMELVRGKPMSEVLGAKPRELRALLVLLEKAARGVAAAHAIGVVHRDVKPANILVTPAGEPKVGDFGLAHWMDSDTMLTKTGTPLGTPMYMAPEQVRGETAVTPAADVYALGSILYEILTGTPPHKGENTAEIFAKILNEDAPRPRRVDTSIPRELETVALKAIDKDPLRRYPDAGEFADDLKRWLDGEPVRARPVSAVGRTWRKIVKQRRILLPAIAAAAVAGALWAWRESGQRLRLDRAKAREQAARLVEEGRTSIDRAILYQYQPDVDYEELVRQVDEGQSLLDRAIAISPDFAVAHHLQGQAWEIKGWDDKAEASWREAIRLDPGLTAARFRLGRRLLVKTFLERIGDPAEEGPARQARMAAWIAEAVSEIEAASSGRQEGEMLGRLASAMHAYLKQDFEKAQALSREAIERFKGAPGAEEFHWLIGISVTYDNATRLSSFSEAIKVRPNYALALFCRAAELLRDKRYPEAVADLDRVLKINPRFKLAWLNRGLAWNYQREHGRAIADYSEAIRLDPRYTMAWTNRSGNKADLGDLKGAMEDCEQALRINPNYPWGYYCRAEIHQRSGDLERALADVTHAIEIDPLAFPTLAFRTYRAKLHGRLDHWPAAVADYREILRYAPADWPDRAKIKELLQDARSRVREE